MIHSPGMRPAHVLHGRIQRLSRDLTLATDAVKALPPVLRQRVAGGLQTEIAGKAREVDDDLDGPVRSGKIHGADAWARLHALSTEVTALLEECLLLGLGARARSSRPDQPPETGDPGMLALADALVDELTARTPVTAWQSYTIFGVAEAFRSRSRVIQVRYPQPLIWDLPAVAHELGHHVARTWTEARSGRMHNFVDALHTEIGSGDGTDWYWTEELFADAFGAYVLGPAYGLTCVLEGFDPLAAVLPTDSHPPSSARVEVITTALRQLPGASPGRAEELDALWAELVAICEADDGGPAPLPPDWPQLIVALLVDHMPASGYATSREAERLSDLLAEAAAAGEAVTDGLLPTTTLADIVNGAWSARAGTTSTVTTGAIARQATVLADAIRTATVRGGS